MDWYCEKYQFAQLYKHDIIFKRKKKPSVGMGEEVRYVHNQKLLVMSHGHPIRDSCAPCIFEGQNL